MDYDELDLHIMADELTRLYGEDNAKQIMLENKDNLFIGKSSVAYNLGKRSIKFFTLHYLRDIYIGEDKATLSETHYKSWDELATMFNSPESYNKRNYLFPRGFGKTSIINVPTVVWASLYGHSRLTVIGSAIKDTATSFMVSSRELLTQERIINTFGELIDSNLINNTEKLELSNDSMIMVASTRTTLRGVNYKGNRINLLILDDYMSEENTTTSEAREKHWQKFQRNAMPAVEKDKHWVLGFGTTQCKGDFYDRLANDPTFQTSKQPAIKDILVLENDYWKEFKEILLDSKRGLLQARRFYKENKREMEFERIWNYFQCDDLAIGYFTDPETFLQEFQLEFVQGNKKMFSNVVYYSDYVAPRYMAIDPATTNAKENDYTAFALGAISDDVIYIPYGEIGKYDFDEYISRAINILKEFPSIEKVYVEKQTYNRADVIAMKNIIDRDEELRFRGIEFVNEHQSKNKENKIKSIVGDINLGRVQFNNVLKDSNAIRQLKDFKGVDASPHDDFPDVLAELVIQVREDNLNDGTVQVFDLGLLY